MIKKTYLRLAILAVALGGFLWWSRWAPRDASPGGNDPFAGVAVPAKYTDQATRQRVQQEIDGTKAKYAQAPEAWDTWIAIGNLRTVMEDYQGAIAAFKKSIGIQSNNVLAYRNIANIYGAFLRDWPKAVEYYKLAIKNQPGDFDLYIELSRIYELGLKQRGEAEKMLIDGSVATNSYPDIQAALVEFYKRAGEPDK